MKMNHYEVLGVKKNATQEEIQSSFRRQAMQKHPDRGGNQEEFVAIQKAYSILMNPEARRNYDETGSDEDQPGVHPGTIIAQILEQALQHQDVRYDNIVETIRDHLKTQRRGLNAIPLIDNSKRLRELRKRTKADIILNIAQSKRKDNINNYLNLRRTRTLIDQCLDYMKDWTYLTDAKPQYAQTFSGGSFTHFVRTSHAR